MCSGKKRFSSHLSLIHQCYESLPLLAHSLLMNDVQSVINLGDLHVVCIYSNICITES